MDPKFTKSLLVIVASLCLQVTAQAQPNSNNINPQPQARSVIKPSTHQINTLTPTLLKISTRDEPEGAECSPEGQWNCMPDTWQRCAAGRWSQVMDLAEGTICTPEGLTEEITIEHDGSVNGGDDDGEGNDGGDTFSGGARTGVVGGFAVAVGVFALL